MAHLGPRREIDMRIVGTGILVLACIAGSLVSGQSAPTNTPAQQAATEIHIGPGDLLGVKVFGVSELSTEARVNAQGEVVLPLLGQVQVQGMTTHEAQLLIERELHDRQLLKEPQVTIIIAEYATQGISILGEVQKPGIYPLLGPRRLYDVISVAGGTTPRAGKMVTITHREKPDTIVTVTLSSDPAKTRESNVEVLPGDTIIVAKAGVVYVVGDVAKPSGFVMENNERLTVLQAIALAGGANKTAALGHAKVIRRSTAGVQEIPIPLNRILAAQAEDIPLQPEDILFVPNSAAKSALRRSADTILQITTGVAIYRPW
jgi:polysaccharide biosynthesis/export protein